MIDRYVSVCIACMSIVTYGGSSHCQDDLSSCKRRHGDAPALSCVQIIVWSPTCAVCAIYQITALQKSRSLRFLSFMGDTCGRTTVNSDMSFMITRIVPVKTVAFAPPIR